jgi:hypothetical protein
VSPPTSEEECNERLPKPFRFACPRYFPIDEVDAALLRRAVDMCPGLRVIYTTGGGLTDGMSALFVEGGTFLPKPYNRQRLVGAGTGDGEITEKRTP